VKRPLFVIGVTFALATRAAFVLSGGTALQLSVALFVTAVALELLVKRRGLSVALLAAALALGSYALYDLRSVKPFRAVEGATVEVSGLLLEKSGQGGSAGFTLLADFPGASSLPGGQRVVVRTSKELSWEPGEYVRCLIKAQFPGNTASADYYRSAGVALTGRLRGNVLQAPGERHRFQRVLLRVRQRMHQNLQRNLPQRSAQVLGAVVLGLQGEVPPNTYTAVSRLPTGPWGGGSGCRPGPRWALCCLRPACRTASCQRPGGADHRHADFWSSCSAPWRSVSARMCSRCPFCWWPRAGFPSSPRWPTC